MESRGGRGRRAGRDGGRVNVAEGSGRVRDDGAGDAGVTAGAGVGRPEQARVSMPDRRESAAEHNRVPGWLQTGAAWSWRLLILALAVYLITRMLGILYIVVVPCVAAL